jgi:hypothetical protein
LLRVVTLPRARDYAEVLFRDLMRVGEPAATHLLDGVDAAAYGGDPPVLGAVF